MSGPEKPRRRRALSLRALMLLVLVVGGWLGWKARRASIQRRAVAEIREVGGWIGYDAGRVGGPKIYSPDWAPRWLREAIGDEYFQEPPNVHLGNNRGYNGPAPTDATLDAVARLDYLDQFQAVKVPIGDAGFAKLAATPRLAAVTLLDAEVTDEGLRSLGSFPALEKLVLRSKPGAITGHAFEFIARQARLKQLSLLSLEFSDPAALAPLAKLMKLEFLRLWRSPPDDACLDHLRGLTALKTLDLRDTQLTDAGIDRLERMTQLENLMMDGSRLTDSGLVRLAARPALKHLGSTPMPPIVSDVGLASLIKLDAFWNLIALDASNVTDAGLAHLQALRLEKLRLSGLGVTDLGLADVAASHQLVILELSGTSVTGPGLAVLTGQLKLRKLTLDRSTVEDEGLAVLGKVPALEILELSETPITDTGLATLRQVPGLAYLDLRDTKVTARGLAAFREARPNVKVDAGPVVPEPANPE